MADTFLRYEKIFLISCDKLDSILKSLLQLGYSHQTYLEIKNIYLDTIENNLFRTYYKSSEYQENYRLRSYDNESAFFEIVRKFGSKISVRRSTIPSKIAYDFIKCRNMPTIENGMNSQILKEISHALNFYNLIPKVFLYYERHIYKSLYYKENSISIDYEIIARDFDLTFEKGVYGKNLISNDKFLLKIISSTDSLPLSILKIMSDYNIFPVSFSKYEEYLKYISHEFYSRKEDKNGFLTKNLFSAC